MKESLRKRVGRLIAGGINLVVDSLERQAPEAMMQQALREIDSAIDEVQAELGKELANCHLINRRLMEENKKHEDLKQQLELALRENRDDLAQLAASRQLDIEAQIPILEQEISDSRDHEKELRGYLEALKARSREMQEDLREYQRLQRQTIRVPAHLAAEGEAEVDRSVQARVDHAQRAFQRGFSQLSVLPAREQIDPEAGAKLRELEVLARMEQVRSRVAEVKAAGSSK
jgi:phage shock protein A